MKYFILYFLLGVFFNWIYFQRRYMIVYMLDWIVYSLIWPILIPFLLWEDYRRKNG